MTDFGPLRTVLEAACLKEGCSRDALTVLASQNDAYRLDTPAHHIEARWIALQIDRTFQPDQRIHLRGLHYALVAQGNVKKPNRKIYRNTVADDAWLAIAMKAARWLGYVEFERISDNRNSDPVVFRQNMPIGPYSGKPSAGAFWSGEWGFELGTLHVIRPRPTLDNFKQSQPYALTIFGEKSSLEDVLRPIAESYQADLYLGAGEISDTLLYRMAKDGAEDGRPMVVVTICDFDPAGHQMPISIGRKLQALRDLSFADLQFEVVPLAMTVEQVRELDLPSTPLKETERRADRWREEFGCEQTEIDALATLRPEALRRIVEEGLAPYYDATLDRRIHAAELDWKSRAQRIIDAHIDPEAMAEIQHEVEAIEAEATERVEAIKTEIAEQVADANDRLEAMVDGIELPEAELPGVVLPEKQWHAVLVSSDWDWAEQSRKLKARKTYGEGT
jgi:hypothetical protein